MEVRYDPEADAMYIKLREGEYEISEEIREGIIIDFDKDNNILGIEILDAKERLSPSSVAEMSFKFSKVELMKEEIKI
ncbi:MAG: DUF2283 domain-containing protein [Methanomicrobia archaeon]|nr:DUF2283 domain-containing protein [Methanomicrobia archaeon]